MRLVSGFTFKVSSCLPIAFSNKRNWGKFSLVKHLVCFSRCFCNSKPGYRAASTQAFGGVSGTGKTSVCEELRRRGYVAIHGDRELRYQGRPPTFSSPEIRHSHNLWDVEKVRSMAANQNDEITFFCGGSRSFKQFVDLFDEVFILDVDARALTERLDRRTDDWGKSKSERELILRLHATKEDIPSNGIVLDATQPLVNVVDEILNHVRA